MKKKQAILLVIATMLLASLTIFAAQTYTVRVNGNTINGKVIVEKGTTYVPLRAISEALGCNVYVKNGVIDISNGVATLSDDVKIAEPTSPTTPTKTEVTPTVSNDKESKVSDDKMIEFATKCADKIIEEDGLKKTSYEVSKHDDKNYLIKMTHRAKDSTQMMITDYWLIIDDTAIFNTYINDNTRTNGYCGYHITEGNSIGL